eukprot:Gb_12549 [translate_table: standard]
MTNSAAPDDGAPSMEISRQSCMPMIKIAETLKRFSLALGTNVKMPRITDDQAEIKTEHQGDPQTSDGTVSLTSTSHGHTEITDGHTEVINC